MNASCVLVYVNQRGRRSWCIPLAGMTTLRRTRIVPAIRGATARVMSFDAACFIRDSIMRTFAEHRIPGRIVVAPQCVESQRTLNFGRS